MDGLVACNGGLSLKGAMISQFPPFVVLTLTEMRMLCSLMFLWLRCGRDLIQQVRNGDGLSRLES